jgi:hypothetical protein
MSLLNYYSSQMGTYEFTKYLSDKHPSNYQLYKSEHHLDGPLYWSKNLCTCKNWKDIGQNLNQFIVYHGRILKELIDIS